jgi:hypothetical protein
VLKGRKQADCRQQESDDRSNEGKLSQCPIISSQPN